MSKLLCLNNIYIDIGDKQYKSLFFNDSFDFKKDYFDNFITIKYNNNIIKVNLLGVNYFYFKIIHFFNYIYIFIFNKKIIIYKTVLESKYENSNYYEYSMITFLKFKLKKLIKILKHKLGKEIILPENIINDIIKKTDTIINDIDKLNEQELLYYIQ